MPFIECKQIVKAYKVSDHEIVALRGIDFEMSQGEMIAIIGPSGAGKSSLLNLLGGIDTPTAGQLIVDGVNLLDMNDSQLAEYRLNSVGFIWQNVAQNLLPHRNAIANVTLPMMIKGLSPWQRNKRAKELLRAVGMEEHMHKKPTQLSGGQQQRVAIGVALANEPKILLADEPTGALDQKNAAQVMALIEDIRQTLNLTVLMVTHDLEIAQYADRILTLRDGALGQDLSSRSQEFPHLDKEGKISLPSAARSQLESADYISIEVRPEGILLRPELAEEEINTRLMGLLPQDALPEKQGFFSRLFRRGKSN